MTPDTDPENIGPFHCTACRSGYDGYHRCPEGEDRVVFVCTDCGELKNRAVHQMDVEGIRPSRCVSCTFERMGR